ncbi:MAG: hypothetical protein FWH01_17620, partial [Oscillospiraceae bacterium]|nr:hypothetical protein [Oscillospiraceae bacterium]
MDIVKTKVCYEEFGAVGDGVVDDFAAIRRAHAYANEHELSVVADPTKSYYIGNEYAEALIGTDTDWGTARFIIDDTGVTPEKRGMPVFRVISFQEPYALDVSRIKKGQMRIDAQLPANALVVAIDSEFKQFRRVGLNQSSGHPKTDCFILDQTGTILTPVLWDFDRLTSLTAHPIDKRMLTIKGGIFTTVANQAESRYTYYSRGILVRRSNVTLDGLVHDVTGELDHGAPYHGFVRTEDCAYVAFRDCHFTGHKIYETIGAANLPVMMGSYDISLHRSIGISFINCKQDNILDSTLWGVFTSNYCKDILVDGCTFSRVDSHMDVTNYAIKNSIIGWQGLKAIGHGRMLVENVTIFAGEVVQLRGDYGSTWDGDLVIRNVIWYPTGRALQQGAGSISLITSTNTGDHDFGYVCSQPRNVTIENLRVMDGEFSCSVLNGNG